MKVAVLSRKRKVSSPGRVSRSDEEGISVGGLGASVRSNLCCGPRISGNAFLRATKAELEDCNARPYRYDSRRFG